jgi:hypothetical protein
MNGCRMDAEPPESCVWKVGIKNKGGKIEKCGSENSCTAKGKARAMKRRRVRVCGGNIESLITDKTALERKWFVWREISF